MHDDTTRRSALALASAGLIAAFVAGCAHVDTQAEPWPLENVRWKLASLRGQPLVGPSPRRDAQIQLLPNEHRVAGSTGCNRLAGRYELEQDQLRFGQMASTRMACPFAMGVEQSFLQALKATASWRIAGERLTLLDAGGGELAGFAPQSLRYRCGDKPVVLAYYDNEDPQRGKVSLVLDGQTYDLVAARAASGVRYVTPEDQEGRAPGMGLEWWTKGRTATLREGPAPALRASRDQRVLASCEQI